MELISTISDQGMRILKIRKAEIVIPSSPTHMVGDAFINEMLTVQPISRDHAPTHVNVAWGFCNRLGDEGVSILLIAQNIKTAAPVETNKPSTPHTSWIRTPKRTFGPNEYFCMGMPQSSL
jgi:hypothetical protein